MSDAAERAWKHYAGDLADHPKVAGSKRNFIAGYTADKGAELFALRSRVAVLEGALEKAADAMDSVTVFVASRERINRPTGEAWWEMEKSQARAALTKEPTP